MFFENRYNNDIFQLHKSRLSEIEIGDRLFLNVTICRYLSGLFYLFIHLLIRLLSLWVDLFNREKGEIHQ